MKNEVHDALIEAIKRNLTEFYTENIKTSPGTCTLKIVSVMVHAVVAPCAFVCLTEFFRSIQIMVALLTKGKQASRGQRR